MKTLNILYLNGITDSFSEEQLDCSTLTIAGHAANLVEAYKKLMVDRKTPENVFVLIDRYHLVRMDQVVSIRLS